MQRVKPEDYLVLQEDNTNNFREGIIIGATLIIIGVILGGIIMYMGGKH